MNVVTWPQFLEERNLKDATHTPLWHFDGQRMMQTFLPSPNFFFTINRTVTTPLPLAKEWGRLSRNHFNTKNRLSYLCPCSYFFLFFFCLKNVLFLQASNVFHSPRIPSLLCTSMVLAIHVRLLQYLPHCILSVHLLCWIVSFLGAAVMSYLTQPAPHTQQALTKHC